MSKIGEKVKNMLRNWLQIQPAAQNSIVLQEPLSHQASVIRNQIWYRGEAAELEQLYKQLGAQDSTNAARFWAAAWNILFALYMEIKYPELQDIPTRIVEPVEFPSPCPKCLYQHNRKQPPCNVCGHKNPEGTKDYFKPVESEDESK